MFLLTIVEKRLTGKEAGVNSRGEGARFSATGESAKPDWRSFGGAARKSGPHTGSSDL
jgi:hypothetical protein